MARHEVGISTASFKGCVRQGQPWTIVVRFGGLGRGFGRGRRFPQKVLHARASFLQRSQLAHLGRGGILVRCFGRQQARAAEGRDDVVRRHEWRRLWVVANSGAWWVPGPLRCRNAQVSSEYSYEPFWSSYEVPAFSVPRKHDVPQGLGLFILGASLI